MNALKELPLSRRHGESLATLLPPESLEHHMVLPAETEQRFARIECEYAAKEPTRRIRVASQEDNSPVRPSRLRQVARCQAIGLEHRPPLVKVRFDALISSYFGESVSTPVLLRGRKGAPGVLLLDECDFIARSRTNSKDIGELCGL